MRRPIGAVVANRPPDGTSDRRETVAVALEALPVIVAHGLDPANDKFVALFHALEADATCKRQFLLRRIDDLKQMAFEPAGSKLRHGRMDRFERREEIADQHQLPGA